MGTMSMLCRTHLLVLNIAIHTNNTTEAGHVVLLACARYTMVVPATHFEMEACPNTLGAYSTHTWEQ